MADSVAPSRKGRQGPRVARAFLSAPSNAAGWGLLLVLSAVGGAAAAWSGSDGRTILLDLAVLFLLPTLLAVVLTPPTARALGGRLSLRRSLLLADTALAVGVALLLLWRLASWVSPVVANANEAAILVALLGPSLWFRQMSLFGLSRPSHARSLPPALVQPALGAVGVFALFAPTESLLLALGLILTAAFLSCALLLRAADRPIRREFGVSGVALIRPLLDHINLRDPAATESLERFFRRFAKPATLGVQILAFRRGPETVATIVLPTVHPGPFAALGGSDLPRKLTERLGPSAGTVFVPHTPCNHDLDLPSGAEVAQVGQAVAELAAHLEGPQRARASPLVGPEGGIARAQALGDTALVLVSQAPLPTDDIDFSVADEFRRRHERSGGPRLLLVDGHNSYVEDEGDITYGTPTAERMMSDAGAALASADAGAVDGPVSVGRAVRTDYGIGTHGIGPMGIRALVVRAGPSTTAYVLIDGNNLVIGHRARILEGLRDLVTAAEVMTTDNHVVHEVDGSINPVGERYDVAALTEDIRALVTAAIADARPVDVYSGSATIPEVPVLGPDWTARLLTSLGDTVSMFAHAFLMTFLLLLAAAVLVLAALY